MVNTNIKATNLELVEHLVDHTNKKLSSLEKYSAGESIDVAVELAKNNHKDGDVFRAEFRTFVFGKSFYAFSEKPDLYSAIDEAEASLTREIKRSKERDKNLFRRGARSVKKMMKGLTRRNPMTSKYED
ncbi:MAG: ribosome-associated translation inhibitor RaiA [Candidatus Nomurabacteria bacterium]|nr:MAG: ribosome-associated translation inhibitor RaiA [Candidatus Nomurabacteria bacterium]